ncbi:MAG: ZIP family metal transporter, partial [Vicinamibacteria bacterium]|nr:ZIP family metal transporter [Vicinamibacteria bacterium]
QKTLRLIILPLVAFSAGSLLGGAFFHMLPAAVVEIGTGLSVYVWLLAGFSVFFALEQFLHWHHCHRESAACKSPTTYLILLADAAHNFIGGISVAGAFLIDIRLGIMTWLAAAAHEVPQELGDFAVLIHGGWEKKNALAFNFLSALTFPLGGLVAFVASRHLDVRFLLPFAAGNFLYIGASDLVPEVNRHHSLRISLLHFSSFAAGILLLLAMRLSLHHAH